MKQTARIISTYSADVMGVCSALFELGGMTVMHDPSGCNSTYTTHDEPRWYDMDSMVYISGLSEMEAIMGDDDKLIGDICDAANEFGPAFIAIAGSPIPMMTGFDYYAAASVIEKRTGIPSFGFATSGMNTYIHGASMALAGIAERMVYEPDPGRIALPLGMITRTGAGSTSRLMSPVRVNILGLTPLDFSVVGMDASIAGWFTDLGFEVISRWAMGSTLDELRSAALADVNLVVSAAGLGAAEVMQRKFGIPYIIGLPIGPKQSSQLALSLENAALRSRAARYAARKGGSRAAGSGNTEAMRPANISLPDSDSNQEGSDAIAADIVIIGEGITSLALARAIELEKGISAKVLCATECPDGILREPDRMTPDEDDIIPELEGARIIIADPLYRPICPADARFIDLPCEAFSGRIYRDSIPDLIADPDAVLSKL